VPTGYYRGFDERDYMLQGAPTATLAENFPHDQITTDLVASLVTQVMTSVAIPLIQGDIITKMSVLSGATALGTPAHAWMALYSPAGALLGQSTDVPAQALAANTVLTHTFAATIPITATGVYFAAIMIQATVVPTLVGKQSGAIVAGQLAMNTAFVYPAIAQNSGSALTTTAPATIASPTNQIVVPYVVLT
jgi:hypothetical protein